LHHIRQLLRGVLPQRRMFKARRLLSAIALSAALGAGALILVPASSEGSTQDHNRLSAYVVATNRGPLPRCSDDQSDCMSVNLVQEFIHIVNANPLTNLPGFGTRASRPNAFVVSSIDETFFVDGVDVYGTGTLTPPPNVTDRFGSAGRWPVSVTCGQPPTVPCNVVTSPAAAILPGEDTVIWWEGWFHGQSDPNGTLVMRFTIHGTLNGNPVDLTTSSPPIREID
jgi:hypothetical protein